MNGKRILTRWLGGLAVLSGADLSNQVAVIVPIEWHGPMNQSVQQNTQGPAVHLGALVRSAVHDLWGRVQRAAAKSL